MFNIVTEALKAPQRAGHMINGNNRRTSRVHIIFSPAHRIAFAPLPKNACTSMKMALYTLMNGQPFVNTNQTNTEFVAIHKHFASKPRNWLKPYNIADIDAYRFAILRDPLERYISAYRNRIWKLADFERTLRLRMVLASQNLPTRPDINFLTTHLDKYRASDVVFGLHFFSQAELLRDRRLFHRFYSMNNLAELASDIEERAGAPFNLPHENRSHFEPAGITMDTALKVVSLYEDDYRTFPDFFSPTSSLGRLEDALARSGQNSNLTPNECR